MAGRKSAAHLVAIPLCNIPTQQDGADPSVPDDIDEWLEQYNTFSIYQVLPELIELWGLNVQTQVESKKNLEKLSGK